MATKWTILEKRRAEAQRVADELDSYLRGMENTRCNLTCDGCGEVLATEADFAKHFTIPDERFLNLGSCPNRDR